MAENKLPQDLAQVKAGVEGMTESPPLPGTDLSGASPAPADDMPELPGASEIGDVPSPEEFEGAPSAATSFEAPSSQDFGNVQPKGRGGGFDEERIHEIAEAVLNEKWDDFIAQTGNIILWKDRVSNEIIAIKQELIRISQRFENLQNAMSGKVREYSDDMKNIHSEMKALEKVFEKILEPLTENIKELSKITEQLKKR